MWPLRTEEKRGMAWKWQYRGGCFPHNAHTPARRHAAKKIRAAPQDAALILAIQLPLGRNRCAQRATHSALTPTCVGAWVARMIAPFTIVSLVSWSEARRS